MTALWHSLINVGIVVGALVTAAFCFVDKHPLRNSLLLLLVGISCYGIEVSSGIDAGLCAPSSEMALLGFLSELDDCGDPYGYFLSVAQIAIIGAVVTWVALAWAGVLRKYDEEREDGTDET